MNKATTLPKKHTFIATASLITGLSVAERSLGFLYRIVLARLIGAEGMGIYQVALSLFSVFLTMGTGGIPVTVSRFISKSKAENKPLDGRKSVSAGLLLSTLLTAPIALFLILFPSTVSFLFTDDSCLPVFRILMSGLFFSSIFAVIRGSFWGNKNFLLPAVLELTEEIVMVIAGILLLQNVSSFQRGATLAAWAVVLSYLVSFTLSVLSFFIKGGALANPKSAIKPLFNASLPITSVRAGGSLINSAVAVVLPLMLVKSGVEKTQALQLFGAVSGMAMPILFIPSTVIGALSLVLVPELSEDFYRKNYKRLYHNVTRGISTALFVACFLTPFFYVLGDELGRIAFSNPLAGECIRKGCIVLIPMSITMITTGILNSMGFEKQTFTFYFVSAATLLVCVLFLPAFIGVYAYVVGLIASFIVNALCNLVFLFKNCPHLWQSIFQNHKPLLRALALALFCILPVSLLGSLLSALLSRVFGETLALLIAGACVGIVETLIYCLFGIIPVKSIFAKKRRKMANFS